MAKPWKQNAPTRRSRGDTRPIVITITDPDSGAVADLTGATSAKFYLIDEQLWLGEDYDAPYSRYNQGVNTTTPGVLKVTAGTCTFNTPRTDGKVTYSPAAADTDTAGLYIMQVKVTLSDGTIISRPGVHDPAALLIIEASLPSLA